MRVALVVALIIAILAFVIALQNTASVDVTFLFWDFRGSLALIVVCVLVAGVVIGLLGLLPGFIRVSRQARRQQKRLTALESSLAEPKRRLADLQQPQQPLEEEQQIDETGQAADHASAQNGM